MQITSLTRRQLIASAVQFGVLETLIPHRAAIAAESLDYAQLAENMAIWGLPLVLTGRYLRRSQEIGFGFNEFYLNQTLATVAQHIFGPNIDTIYGLAWLDLSQGPVVISVPEANDRYYSIQLMDVFQNTFAYIGRRETGTHAGAFAITPPNWPKGLPVGVHHIPSSSSLVLAMTRTLVKGSDDLKAAQAVQAGFAIAPLSTYPSELKVGMVVDNAFKPIAVVDLSGVGAGYFDELLDLLRRYPPTGIDAQRLAAFRSSGATDGVSSLKERLTPDQLASAFDRALLRIKSFQSREDENGWGLNLHTTKFIGDPLRRAKTNSVGPGTNIADEALYISRMTDAAGEPLVGTKAQRLRFPPGGTPPVKAFWALILYDENEYIFDNPLNRYEISDRTEGLVYEPDGGLSIVISSKQPNANTNTNTNWLPAPDGHYSLTLRTYQPSDAILQRRYLVPQLQPA